MIKLDNFDNILMMKIFLKAFITILIQFPVIFWFFLGISLYRTNDLVFGDTVNFLIFFSLIYLTFFVAYTIEKYNNFRFTIYLLIPLSLGVMNLFERSWIAQLLLFLSYIALMGVFLRKERFSVYYKAIDTNIMKKVARFDTKEKAKQLIKDSIDRTLKKLAIDVTSSDELISSYLKNNEIQYRVNKKEFNDIGYVKKIAPLIYQQKLQNMIDGGFKVTKDQKILKTLSLLEESEIVEVNRLQDFIEIVYIRNARKEYLTIEDRYYMNSQAGIGRYFEFKQQRLQQGFIKQELDSNGKFKEIEFLKEQHPILSDIYYLIKIFYLEDINHTSKTGEIVIIYKTSTGFTNSVKIFFGENGITIDKYENIFSFSTKILEDKRRTQLEYSYSDKYFEPKKYFDTIDNRSRKLTRKKLGDNAYEFPCTTFGKDIWFGVDNKKGVLAYNLSSNTKEYQMIDSDLYTYLDSTQKDKLHSFLLIAQLYLNTVFINKEFDNYLVLDTNEYLEHHQKIETFEANLKISNWEKEDYYDNGDARGRYPTQFAYVCYDKKDTHKMFIILEETDWVDRKVTIKFNNDVKEQVINLLKDTI